LREKKINRSKMMKQNTTRCFFLRRFFFLLRFFYSFLRLFYAVLIFQGIKITWLGYVSNRTWPKRQHSARGRCDEFCNAYNFVMLGSRDFHTTVNHDFSLKTSLVSAIDEFWSFLKDFRFCSSAFTSSL